MIAIDIKDLSKKYQEIEAVKNLNLQINKGELFALLGLNGAGKTTTIKMLTGLILPTSGEIKIMGIDLISNKYKVKSLLNISPQETAIASNLTVLENLKFMAGIYKIKNSEQRINELVKLFKLDSVLNRYTKNLSGGWQRKLSLAIALINEPKILFLDEPTLGLDVIARKELWQILVSLKGEMTIILTTHYMEEAEYLSDRIGIMNKGNLVEVATSKEILKRTKTKRLEDAFIRIVGEDICE